MNDRDIQTALDTLRECVDGHVYRKIDFVGSRETRDGQQQEVVITILDGGENSPANLRYHCKARSKDGKRRASGNASETLTSALRMVHWGDLDRPEDGSSS